MSYQRGRSEANSPTYWAGVDDGERDNAILASCPPGEPLGPTPPETPTHAMYDRGYRDSFTGVVHSCKQCSSDQDDASDR